LLLAGDFHKSFGQHVRNHSSGPVFTGLPKEKYKVPQKGELQQTPKIAQSGLTGRRIPPCMKEIMELTKTKTMSLFNVKPHPAVIIAVGALAIFFTGYQHIWSIYQPYVMKLTGWDSLASSMNFYFSLIFFVVGAIIGGRAQDKTSPQITILIGGLLFPLSIFLSGFALGSTPFLMYVFYGAMHGLGSGTIYTTVLSTAQKWFPKKTGFATGIVVMANGLCGFILTPFVKMTLVSFTVQTSFLIISGMIFVSWILAVLFLRNPDKISVAEPAAQKPVPAQKQYTTKEMLATPHFYILLGVMMLGLVSYFLVSPVSQTLQIGRGIPDAIAVASVMIGSLSNASARFILPTLADRLGRTRLVLIVLASALAGILLLVFSTSYQTTVAVIITYACYGGIIGQFPSLTSSLFGTKYSGGNYGMVLIGFGLAAILAPSFTAASQGLGLSDSAAFSIGAICLVLALLLLLVLTRLIRRKPLGNPTGWKTK
jgi:MFS transporter, OFA family, oxalate/formate antiporter